MSGARESPLENFRAQRRLGALQIHLKRSSEASPTIGLERAAQQHQAQRGPIQIIHIGGQLLALDCFCPRLATKLFARASPAVHSPEATNCTCQMESKHDVFTLMLRGTAHVNLARTVQEAAHRRRTRDGAVEPPPAQERALVTAREKVLEGWSKAGSVSPELALEHYRAEGRISTPIGGNGAL